MRVVWKLLVSLCLAIYCGMVIWGNGPTRLERGAERPLTVAAAKVAATSGVRVLPVPKRPVRIGPQAVRRSAPEVAAAAAPAPTAPTAQSDDAAGRELAALVMAALDRPTATMAGQPANTQRRWITANTANVRAGPNKRSKLAGKIGRGGEVFVLWAEPNGWVKLRAADGKVAGYVHKSLLTDTPPKATLIAASD